ncbi:MAG: GtrA family protein [Clostridiales bacterium]|nr:GtrA family protein [Clostridiales bacterium]
MKKIYNWFASWGIVRKLCEKPFFAKVLSYEFLSYLFFGALTTLVNFIAFAVVKRLFGEDFDTLIVGRIGSYEIPAATVTNAIAWLTSLFFAFFTNKLWVFESRSFKPRVLAKELSTFVAARLLSGVLLEIVGFDLLNKFLHERLADKADIVCWIAKLIIAIGVIIFNFVASKLVSFRKKKTEAEDNGDELQKS